MSEASHKQLDPKHPRLARRTAPASSSSAAGFAGLNAAKGLAHLPVDVTVVDRRNHHTFQPLLYQVALAVLSPADIAQPIRSILRHQRNTEVLMDEVVAIDVAARAGVRWPAAHSLAYDYLVLATGATHSYFGHDEWEPLAPGLKTIEDAIEIRRRVLLAFELAERQMLEQGWHPPLNFVVIGGGPTGVELAGAISDIAQLYMRHDFRHIDPAKEPRAAARRRSAHSRRLSCGSLRQSRSRRSSASASKSTPDRRSPASAPDGSKPTAQRHLRIEAAVTLWAAGVLASPLGKMLGAPTSTTAAAASSSTTSSIRPACPMSSSSATSPTSSRTAIRSPASPSPPCRWAITSPK